MELPSDPEDTEGESQSLLTMVPDEAGDLWLAYNLIAEGNTVQAVTVRNVPSEVASGGRDTEAAERVKLKLEIKVEPILSSCLDMESTNLERCSLLVTRLVFVHSYCYEVMEIGLSAAKLTAFEYGGNLVKFFLGSSKSGKAPFLGSQRL